MPKLYTTAALILLLGVVIWYVHNHGINYGELRERAKWQVDLEGSAKARAKAQHQAMLNSQKREVKLSEAKKQVYQAVADCYDLTAHHSVLRSLCETGRAPKSLCESPAVGYHLP